MRATEHADTASKHGSEARVSVIVPTYNRRALIGEAIESIRVQTMPHFEVLVVDDGSTDGTADALRERFRDDGRVRIIVKANGGTSCARNRGLEAVRAPYTAFLDSDDLWEPEYLESQLDVLEREGADAVLADAGDAGGKGGETQFGHALWRPPTTIEGIFGGGWALPTVLLLRSEIATALRFDTTYPYAEDTEFLLRFHAAGHRLVLNPRRLASWRDHAEDRKTDETDSAHVLAQIRMLQPYRRHPLARRRLRELSYCIHREVAVEMITAGCWREARPHLTAWFLRRPLRPRVAGRWLRSVLARSSPRPVPAATGRRSESLLRALRSDPDGGASPAANRV